MRRFTIISGCAYWRGWAGFGLNRLEGGLPHGENWENCGLGVTSNLRMYCSSWNILL